MAIDLDIKLKRENKVYHEGDTLRGVVVVRVSGGDGSHNGIVLNIKAYCTLQIISASYYNTSNPLELLNHSNELLKAGKLSDGITEFPFDFTLVSSSNNKLLHETYHGVHINIQYAITVEVKKSFLTKSIVKHCEFMIENKPDASDMTAVQPLEFNLNSSTLQNHKGTQVADVEMKVSIHSINCPINQPFTGKIQVVQSELGIRSIELQLLRVESVLTVDGFHKEVTEIQNIQVADGHVPKLLDIPLYMVFPRLFTRPTLLNKYFKIEFEVSVVVLLDNGHTLSQTIPIKLHRVS